MATATETARREAQRNRLLLKCENINTSDAISSTFKQAAVNALMQNEVGLEASAGEIEEEMRSMLPKFGEIFVENFCGKPSYPILMLKRTADFYGCFKLPLEILETLDDAMKANSEGMLYVWLSYLLHPAGDMVDIALDMYWATQFFPSHEVSERSSKPARLMNVQTPQKTSLQVSSPTGASSLPAQPIIVPTTDIDLL